MESKNNKCFNCKHASKGFKIAGKTYHQCMNSKHEPGFESGDLSPWDTLQEFYNTCNDFEEKTLKKQHMKAFKFYSGDEYWGYSGETEEQAKNQLFEEVGEMDIDKIEEIPESQWDEKNISMWEDNDMSKKPFKTSIREQIIGDYPQQLFTNDLGSF